MTFQGSLGNNLSNLERTFRHPAPMLVAIAISQVLMPLVGWMLGGPLFSDPNIVAGIVLEYSVPIAVTSTMWIGIYAGDMSLALGTLLISTLVSPVTIPATLRLLVGATVEVDTAGMFFDMLVMIALPALAATVLNQVTQGRVKTSLSPALAPLARIFVGLPLGLCRHAADGPWARAGRDAHVLLGTEEHLGRGSHRTGVLSRSDDVSRDDGNAVQPVPGRHLWAGVLACLCAE